MDADPSTIKDIPTDLESLKRKCFKQNLDPSLRERYRRSWSMAYPLIVTHFISIRVVWLLLRMPVSPNQITWASYLIGWASSFFFLRSGAWVLLGALLFELFYILDAVDGQLARARSQKSSGGAFLDDWANFLVPPVVLFAIGMRQEIQWARGWSAFFASFSVLSISILEILKNRFSVKIPASISLESNKRAAERPLRFAYSLIYRSCTMPVVMNLVTLACLFEAASIREPFYGLSFLAVLIYYFALTGTFIVLSKGIHISRSL